MKKIFFIVASILLIDNILADEIDDIINKINNKREAKISKKVIEKTPSPIPKVVITDLNNTTKGSKVTVVEAGTSFMLKGIMNKSANINGKWVKLGEKINGYKLVDVMEDSVYLKDGNRSKMLFFEQNNTKIKIKLGR